MGYNASFLTEADTWALRSLRPLSSPQCHHHASSTLLNDSCPLFNIMSRRSIPAVDKGVPWDALLLSAPPKAGSTLLRKKLVRQLAPSFTNVYGENKGEENDMEKCAVQRASVELAAAPSNRTFAAVLVREPISRFLSGAAEVMRHHCGDWLTWRRANGRDSSRVLVAGKTGKSCRVRTAQGVLDWHEPVAWALLKRAFVRDVVNGYRNKHTEAQTAWAVNAVVGLDALVQIEEGGGGWVRLLAAARLPPELAGLWDGERSSKLRNTRREDLSDDLDDASTEALCREYRVDYACLGYALPRLCSDARARRDAAARALALARQQRQKEQMGRAERKQARQAAAATGTAMGGKGAGSGLGKKKRLVDEKCADKLPQWCATRFGRGLNRDHCESTASVRRNCPLTCGTCVAPVAPPPPPSAATSWFVWLTRPVVAPLLRWVDDLVA